MNRIAINEGWLGLWYRIGAKGNNAWEKFFELIKRYSERHRYYHDFTHIMQVLKEFETVKDLCTNPDAVEMALWTHDSIYETGATNNEGRSMEFTCDMLHNARLPEPYTKEVGRLILLSKDHKVIKRDNDGALFSDIDLSILGQPAEVFNRYERNIWKEWVLEKVVSNDAFVAGRAEILEGFAKRKPIYSTPYFYTKYEKAAKANLKRSLAQLRAAA